ncbi:MAG: hypothetical protein RMJ35_00640 [Phycisphaerales bacterium]|nr:hypothetical protein [Phycisphaerales bacterium]
MSAAVTQPVPVPQEAFGQTGIREYLGTASVVMCAAGVALCLSMWVRSYFTIDMIELFHEDSRTLLHSLNGRFVIARASSGGSPSALWLYNSRPFYRSSFRDSWQPSIWKTIGIEASRPPSNRQGVYWVLRVRWPTAGAILLIWPMVHVLRQFRNRPARLPSETSTYCARCGRPVTQAMRQCACCGRPLGAMVGVREDSGKRPVLRWTGLVAR